MTVHYNYMLDDCPLWYSQVQFWIKWSYLGGAHMKFYLIVHSILQLSHCGVWIDHNYNFIKASNAMLHNKYHSICLRVYLLVLMMIWYVHNVHICMFIMCNIFSSGTHCQGGDLDRKHKKCSFLKQFRQIHLEMLTNTREAF